MFEKMKRIDELMDVSVTLYSAVCDRNHYSAVRALYSAVCGSRR